MTAAEHRDARPWTLAGWNRRAAHALWDGRIGPAAAEELAVVRLPAYRALAAFLVLVVVAAAVLAVPLAGWPALPAAASLVLTALVVVALGVRPMRRAGVTVRDALTDGAARSAAPLNDGRRFDAWVRRNGAAERLRSEDLAALLRGLR